MEQIIGEIVLEPAYRHVEAIRGLEHFDYLWLIWEFSVNKDAVKSTTVRPPRLGGNQRMGVFATRSPFRPNNLGLSCVKIQEIITEGTDAPRIKVCGADLMDGTPIYDIKPYVTYADCYPEARSGFVDDTAWTELEVVIPECFQSVFSTEEWEGLKKVLALDPRPSYHHDPSRVYGMPFAGHDVRFRVQDNMLTVVEVIRII